MWEDSTHYFCDNTSRCLACQALASLLRLLPDCRPSKIFCLVLGFWVARFCWFCTRLFSFFSSGVSGNLPPAYLSPLTEHPPSCKSSSSSFPPGAMFVCLLVGWVLHPKIHTSPPVLRGTTLCRSNFHVFCFFVLPPRS